MTTNSPDPGARNAPPAAPEPALSRIRWVGFDVDGVMTDGGIILAADGTESKRFNSRDGHSLKLLARAGIRMAIITGRRSRVVELRAREVGIESLHQAAHDKLEVYLKILEEEGLAPEETAFAGDDMVDLPIMIRCGYAMAPADAAPEVLSRAHYVARSKGGRGAVRDMAEHLLRGKGLWEGLVGGYLRKDPS
ncbi:MAG: HAD hydrolase family protein [Deltaproteobacteria bacterium]|jgi:3-deoxy-D-manno-octulosonate 8-phosphate phosphatase (KDO 8-P phosphatase)|nr:HAD hydrolase family protein [Deltaproteobacteria bacterium]